MGSSVTRSALYKGQFFLVVFAITNCLACPANACPDIDEQIIRDELGYLNYRAGVDELGFGAQLEDFDSSFSHLRFFVHLTVQQPADYDDSFRLWNKDSNQYFSVDRFGSSDLPVSAELYRRDIRLFVCDKRIKQVALGVDVVASNPHIDQIDVESVLLAVEEYGEYRKRQGLIRRLFYPKLKRIELRFESNEGRCIAMASDTVEKPDFVAGRDGRSFIDISGLREFGSRLLCRPAAPRLVYLRAD